jgi:hypothetical protein
MLPRRSFFAAGGLAALTAACGGAGTRFVYESVPGAPTGRIERLLLWLPANDVILDGKAAEKAFATALAPYGVAVQVGRTKPLELERSNDQRTLIASFNPTHRLELDIVDATSRSAGSVTMTSATLRGVLYPAAARGVLLCAGQPNGARSRRAGRREVPGDGVPMIDGGLTRRMLIAAGAATLAGCSTSGPIVVSVTNREPTYRQKLERVVVGLSVRSDRLTRVQNQTLLQPAELQQSFETQWRALGLSLAVVDLDQASDPAAALASASGRLRATQRLVLQTASLETSYEAVLSYSIEASLYDVASGQRVWRAATRLPDF